MENQPSPPEDPFSLQESRRERGYRRNRRRHRVIVGMLITVVVVAAAGYGAYRLLARDDAGRETPAVTTGQTLATTETSTPGPAGTTVSVSTTSGTTSTISPNLAPQPLNITATPESVDLVVTLQDGTSLTGKTPFSQEVPGGQISIEFNAAGFNPAVRQVALEGPTELKVWLDPEGQLYETVVRFKCGLNPKQVAFSPDGTELWVSFLGGSGLGVYDPTTGEKLGAVQMGTNGAVEVIFTKDGKTVYASQMETASVYEIDRATRTVKRRFETGGTWTKVMLLSPDEMTLWASNWVSNDVSEIDLKTGKVARIIPTVTTPRGLYVTADAKVLYVAGFEDGDIQRIDLATDKGRV
ncbi:MAG: beta-propeller fold lactonase family protein, partial [Thermoleophilia bacterium]|nr:beta-propeller fold lactonase family protein [Thermoleophilia bacterium]